MIVEWIVLVLWDGRVTLDSLNDVEAPILDRLDSRKGYRVP